MEMGLSAVYSNLGIRPDTALGHSFGEISALAAAGTWDLEVAYEVVKARIEAAQTIINKGEKLGMMSLISKPGQRDALLNLVGEDVVLTNINAPNRFIISGKLDAVNKTVAAAESLGLDARLLPIGAAFHSRFMEPFDVPSPAEVPLQPLARGRVSHAAHRYKVRPGDSLGRISAKMLGTAARWREIARLNRISDPRTLRVGQVIRIPARK
jgi:acyl transferase domain-containing protein